MDEKLKNDGKRVMLVRDAGDGKVKGVTGLDKEGNAQTADVTESNLLNLMNVNTQDSALEAFFKKFMSEADNPSHTGIFMMAESALNSLVKIGLDPEELEKHRVDPAAELQKGQRQKPDGESQPFQPMDIEKIDRADLERKGIRWEDMEPHLRAMSFGHKSSGLIEMNPEMEPGGVRVPTKGRISLAEQPDGSIKVTPHYWQDKPNLDAPLYGTKLDQETKANLEQTLHAGKVIELELTPGKKEPCFVSLDKMTSTLEVMSVADFNRRNNIKGVNLTTGQEIDLYGGRKVLLEKMTTRAGYYRDAHIQVDASNRNFSFTYEGLDRNRYAQENNQIRKQKTAEQKAGKQETAADDTKTNLTIHRKIKGAEVPEKAFDHWMEAVKDPAKRQNVQAFHIKGMIDDKGLPFNAWVKPNFEKNKFDFHKYNPKYVKGKGAEVTPAQESRTQVAVNSEGKTDEATKNVREPLKQGQQRPTEGQQKRQDQHRQRQSPPAKRQSPPKAGEKQGGPKL